MNILVTGGAGFIGSHTLVELLKNPSFDVIVADNLSNSREEALRRVKKITGRDFKFYKIDLLDEKKTEELFSENKIDCVIHFAGLKAVGESVQKPLEYYSNNLGCTLSLLKAMKKFSVRQLVFSSSATVYSLNNDMPLSEEKSKTGNCSNPYGWTKFMQEVILKDFASSDPQVSIVLLRYFNPVGAHQSGLIGEDPRGIPNNLMPYICKVAIGKLPFLPVYGNDYPTPDGTGVRDYIHITDLARGHVLALKYASTHTGCEIFNLGTGKPCSVLEMIKAFSRASKREIPYKFVSRRPGDLAEVYSSTDKAEKLLGFKTQKTLFDMCFDSWNFQVKNPEGYDN